MSPRRSAVIVVEEASGASSSLVCGSGGGGALEERAPSERSRRFVLHGNLDKRDVDVNTRWPQVVN
jgi:hypothetical protein